MGDEVGKPQSASSSFTVKRIAEIGGRKHDEVNQDERHQDKRDYQSDERNGEEITLSLSIVNALISGEINDEVKQALSAFAPLGDLTDAHLLCECIAQKGMDHVIWLRTLSLLQALEDAASR